MLQNTCSAFRITPISTLTSYPLAVEVEVEVVAPLAVQDGLPVTSFVLDVVMPFKRADGNRVAGNYGRRATIARSRARLPVWRYPSARYSVTFRSYQGVT